MAVRQINKYIKDIQTKLFPALKNSYNLNMSENPTNISTTLATFNGQLDDNRVIFEFSSNHRDLADYSSNEPVLYLNLYFNYKGTKAGIINLNEINESLEIIYAALYELGYRSQEQLNKEKEQKQKELEKQKQDELSKIKQKRQQIDLELLNKDEIEDSEENDNYQQEVEDSLNEINSDFDLYKNQLIKLNELDSSITIVIALPPNVDIKNKFINIVCSYVNKDICFVSTDNINPPVNQEVSWDRAKNYILKVIEKLNATSSLYASDSEGKTIELSSEEDEEESDGIESGIEI